MLINEITEGTRCWKGYKKKGMKTMFGKRVPNCVKNEDVQLESEINGVDVGLVHFLIHNDTEFYYAQRAPAGGKFLSTADMEPKDVKMVATFLKKYGDYGDFIRKAKEAGKDDSLDAFDKLVIRYIAREVGSNVKTIRQALDNQIDENLRDWFGKGKDGGAGGGGWDRYNTKGERIGKCGDSKKGEGKPKCLSKSKAAKLRAKGGKKAIGAAVSKKRRQDPNKNRRGKAKNVSNTKGK